MAATTDESVYEDLIEAGPPAPRETEIVELSLLLPSWQMAALETAAHDQGMTTAQMMRGLIRDFFQRSQPVADRYVPFDAMG
jgi:hypothetical protein